MRRQRTILRHLCFTTCARSQKHIPDVVATSAMMKWPVCKHESLNTATGDTAFSSHQHTWNDRKYTQVSVWFIYSNYQRDFERKSVNKKSFFCSLVVRVVEAGWAFLTQRNEHAALSFKQLTRARAQEEGGRFDQRRKKKHNLINTQKDKQSGSVLSFEIQQVAVDLVVDVRIILLLAQVQAWDVHRRLEIKEETGR